MRIRIVTWNINSVRKRIAHVRRLIRQTSPDIICFQETKVTDNLFPSDLFTELGYSGIYVSGQKAYNGVAIVSRSPLKNIETKKWGNSSDKRYIRATLSHDIDLHNFYIPAGGDDPDPQSNPKFGEKLRFYSEMAEWFRSLAIGNKRVLVGDLNVAPAEADVWCHSKMQRVVSHTPLEIQHYQEAFRSHDWIDAIRFQRDPQTRIFTWWSYRSLDWQKINKGRRLDHIWVTESLQRHVVGTSIIKRTRGWKQPSDHVAS